jgi:hypothetical protein
MFTFGKKSKTQRFEISWPVESNRNGNRGAYAAPQREVPLPPIPTPSETSSTRSGHSPTSSHSSYYSSYSLEQHDQHTPVLALPPRTYRVAESTRSLPLPPPPPRPTTSSTKTSRHSPSSSNSSHPSYASSNTMYTARRGSTAAGTISSCDDRSCQMGDPESDEMFEQFNDQIQISDNLPDAASMEAAGEIPIFDSEGNSRPFKSIYSGDLAIGEQQMVLFVRHFFCGVSLARFSIYNKSHRTNSSTGVSSVHQSPLQEHHPTDLLHPACPNINYNHRSRFTQTHRLLSQSDRNAIPNLRRPHKKAIQSSRHELDHSHRTASRLHERHKRIPVDKRTIHTNTRRAIQLENKRRKSILGRRRIHDQRRKTGMVSSYEEFPGPQRNRNYQEVVGSGRG